MTESLFATLLLLAALTSPLANATYKSQILKIAQDSECARYKWKNRGRAPMGYVKGLSLSFTRGLCRFKANTKISQIMSAANTGQPKTDAFSHYAKIFKNSGIDTASNGEPALVALYTLGLGLGIRESSGKHCEGWDRDAGAERTSSEAEAGLYQLSYDSIGASPELRKLYREYLTYPRGCMLAVFHEGVHCREQNILGTGHGAEFQIFNKECPAFATEYAMTMLRVQRKHFGPINRQEAEVSPACKQMLEDVAQVVDSNSISVCLEIE